MIAKEIRQEVYQRTGGFCECGCWRRFVFDRKYELWKWYQLHHIYWKSEYRWDDRDLAWNLALLADQCHIPKIHERRDIKLDERLKQEADDRLPQDQRSDTKTTRKKVVYWVGMQKYDKQKAKQDRKNQEERFKKNHDGLTPSKWNYRQNKKLQKKNPIKQKSKYKEQVEYFKKTHNWLTPNKYQYQQSKLYLQKKLDDNKNQGS